MGVLAAALVVTVLVLRVRAVAVAVVIVVLVLFVMACCCCFYHCHHHYYHYHEAASNGALAPASIRAQTGRPLSLQPGCLLWGLVKPSRLRGNSGNLKGLWLGACKRRREPEPKNGPKNTFGFGATSSGLVGVLTVRRVENLR